MKKLLSKTRCSVKLRQSSHHSEWHLYIESYPVFVEGKPHKVTESLNRTITTPIWETNRYNRPKRDINGIITCRNEADRIACAYADKVRILRQREYDTADLYTPEEEALAKRKHLMQEDFIKYFEKATTLYSRTGSPSMVKSWQSSLKHLRQFTSGAPLPFLRLTAKTSEDFRCFLLTAHCSAKSNAILSPNSASNYYRIFRSVLRKAYDEGYLPADLTSKTKGIQMQETRREHLTLEELNRLASTPCPRPEVKRAALFSALTGLRHSDIKKLRWSEIREESGQYRIDFTQKKTGGVEYTPISAQAYRLCGHRPMKKAAGTFQDQLVFPGLPDTTWIIKPLHRWLLDAGITRHITFHCFRHTYATLLLTNGIDLYTVSRMLGHTSIKTTQIYAKVVDAKKIAAANTIKINCPIPLGYQAKRTSYKTSMII